VAQRDSDIGPRIAHSTEPAPVPTSEKIANIRKTENRNSATGDRNRARSPSI
jgi:hypothetical protein